MDNVRCMEKATKRRERDEEIKKTKAQITEAQSIIGPSWTLDIKWQDSSKRVGNPQTSRKESDVAVTLARLLHVSKVGQSKDKGKTKQATQVTSMHMEVSALFGRFVWRGVNIDNVTIHPYRGSRINPTQKQDSTTGEFRFKGQNIGRAASIQSGVTNFQLYHCLSVSACSRDT